jgi:large subunit ribosomal protein L7Ae
MDNAFEIIEVARKTGKIKKGTNEVTKLIEKGEAKFVVYAKDVTPREIVMHLPLLAKEKGIKYAEVERKEELGAAAGLPVGTAAVAVVQEGDAKELIKNFR